MNPDLKELHSTESSSQKDRWNLIKRLGRTYSGDSEVGRTGKIFERRTEKGIPNPEKNILSIDS